MNKFAGFSKVGIILGVLGLVLIGVITYLVIDAEQKAVRYEDYDSSTIIEASDASGNISEHIKGNADAPVLIVEYANYQCPHCADMNPIVAEAIEASNGQLGVIFRNVTMSSFPNSKAAAAAAEAAGLQGYWQAYSDKLFAEQVEWSSASGSKRTELFNKYFEEVSNGQGDLEKFNQDIASDAVAKKLKFDTGIATENNVGGTPNFYIDGQFIDMDSGGTLDLDGKTFTFEPVNSNEDFVQLFQDIIALKTGA